MVFMVRTLVAVAVFASSLGTVARADELAPADVPAAEPPAEQPPAEVAPVLAPPSSYQPIARPPVRDSYHAPDETPPLSGGRLVGELAIGSLFAVGGGIGGAYLGFGLEMSSGCDGEFCGLGGVGRF